MASKSTSEVTLRVNGETRRLDIDPEAPLLYALRQRTGAEEREIRLRYRTGAAPARCLLTASMCLHVNCP